VERDRARELGTVARELERERAAEAVADRGDLVASIRVARSTRRAGATEHAHLIDLRAAAELAIIAACRRVPGHADVVDGERDVAGSAS